MQFGGVTTYKNKNGDIVHSEGSETEPTPLDKSVCCALYNPEDISTFAMKAACIVLDSFRFTYFYQQSPYMCTSTLTSIKALDLNMTTFYDLGDEIISETAGDS